MSILYCVIPHFATTLARRDEPDLLNRPLVLVDPERRVFAASPEAAAQGVVVGQPVRAVEVRCPEARLLEADIARYRSEFETLLELLEMSSPCVEPHGWGAAYVDLGDLARHQEDGVSISQDIGRAIRRELGEALQPALGWDSTKFTAQAATRYTHPGRIRAVASTQERTFLRPLSITLLPLDQEALQRLGFLGLRTLGQYAALPTGAVLQQFGRPGKLAQRCARGEDGRPVVPRAQERRLIASHELGDPLVNESALQTLLQRLLSPLLRELQDNLQACGQLRLMVHFEDGEIQERERTFLFPTAEKVRILPALRQSLSGVDWRAGVTALEMRLERIQDAVTEQLSLFVAETEQERKLRELQQYIAARFGANRLRRAVLSQPAALLPEWRVGWLEES